MEKQNLIIDDPKSILAEAFRVLRTNLQFSSIDKPYTVPGTHLYTY